MITSYRSWHWWLCLASWLAIGGAITSSGDRALAQIAPDTTLGSENSTVTSTDAVDIINGGATRGANLFHSFQEFNVGEGRAAYFTNPNGIENILSRVTGGNVSKILGKLGVLGNANLFLINPNGIIFGPNASLDIRSSFVASTASSLKFADGKFSATVPEATPLLTISVPLGLQLGTSNSGTIASAGNLTVGQNLTLAAGNLDLQGQLRTGGNLTLQALDIVRLTDSAENPLIAKAGKHLVVQGNQAVDIFALNHPTSGLFSSEDMVLRSANAVAGDAHYTTGGNFRVEQLDGKLGSLFSPYDPIIRASGDVTFDSYTGASLHILAGGSVNIPGNLRITGRDTLANSIIENVTLSDGTTVVAVNGYAQPTVDIRAGTTAFGIPGISKTAGLSRGTPSTGDATTSADISIGSITNRGGAVFLTNQYNPNFSLSGGAIQVGAIDTRVTSGNAGSVTIDSRGSIKLSDTVRATVVSNGNGGAVTLKAQNDITTGNISTLIRYGGVGNGGNISLTSTAGAINTSAGSLDAGTTFGNGGAIALNARNDITVADMRSNKVGTDGEVRDGGNISLTSTAGAIDTTRGILYSFSENGNAGAVTLNATGSMTTGDIYSYSLSNGNAGAVTLNATGSMTTGDIQSYSLSNGNGGAVTLKAQNDITTGNISTLIRYGGVGNGGNISLTSTVGAINTSAGSLDAGTTFGNGGAIALNARNDITVADMRSNKVGTDGEVRDGGNISLTSTAGAIDTTRGILYSFSENGTGGNITLNATGSITIGDIHSFSLGNGKSADINLTSNARVSLANSFISNSSNNISGSGKGGDINITAGSLFVTDGTQLIVSAFGQGDAGSVNIHARDTVSFDGSIAYSTAERGAVGNSGNINISTGSLSVTNGAQLQSLTRGQGDAGSVNIHARDTVSFDGSIAYSTAEREAVGNGANINISTGSLSVTNGAQLQSSTRGQGDAGSVNIHARDTVSFDGSIAYSTAEREAVGNGGDINISTGSLSITNSAGMVASSRGTGAAGNIDVEASSIRLDNQAALSSDTIAEQGNIILRSRNLVLRRGSKITTDATGTATGGNITIDTGVIAALENSDISANASEGPGGRVIINAQGIFGTEFRNQPTSESDITATSDLGPQFSGTVEINTPDVDLSRGLVNLPTQPVDTEVTQACTPGGSQATSEFVVTGRGGLPPNPGESLKTDAVIVDLAALNSEVDRPPTPSVSSNSTSSTPAPIVEAQGWIIAANGEVILTVNAPTVTPHSSWLKTADCQKLN